MLNLSMGLLIKENNNKDFGPTSHSQTPLISEVIINLKKMERPKNSLIDSTKPSRQEPSGLFYQ